MIENLEPFSNSNEFLKNLEAILQQKILVAKENALTQEEYEEIAEADFESENIQSKRDLTDKEVFHYHQFRDKLNKATIEVETLAEARRVMVILGRSTYSTNDTLSHENAHANKADQLEAEHLGYRFVLIKEDDEFAVQPLANYYIPDEWSKEKQNAVNIEITKAPEEYGNKMSEGDKRYLKELEK